MTVAAFLLRSPLFEMISKRMITGGLYNGYVAFSGYLPDSYMKHMNGRGELDNLINIHGGITFDQVVDFSKGFSASGISVLNTEVPKEGTYRVIGFDTLHCDDTMEYWTIERTKSETLHLLEQVEKLLIMFQIKKLQGYE